MSTAVAAPPATNALSPPVGQISPRASNPLASNPLTSSSAAAEREPRRGRTGDATPRSAPTADRPSSNGKSSPGSAPRAAPPPLIRVKKEPGSPTPQSARHRPKRLDLSSSLANSRPGPQTARPSGALTGKSSAGLGIQEVGMACLSPGFATHDPAMREQLQRSLDVRDQQRMIIEARNKGSKPGHDGHDGQRSQDNTLFGVQMRTPPTSRRKGPPPGLSINAPAASQFADESRVVQSAPLHQTFTGLRPGDPPFSRHSQLGPSGLSQTSHIHHVPATQTTNRLPPISDVFDRLQDHRGPPSSRSPGHQNGHPPVPSPGFSHQPPPPSARTREFRSAEEAVQGLSGGREDLMPKVVHYGGVQPPTPPSPLPPQQHQSAPRPAQHYPEHFHGSHQARQDAPRTNSSNGRRRDRDEYERDNGSPPSSSNRSDSKRTAFAVRGDGSRDEDWRNNLSGEEKRAEFLRLCERAWDLFHS